MSNLTVAIPEKRSKTVIGYNGCGWVSSLQDELRKCPDIQFGICSICGSNQKIVDENGTCYYHIKVNPKSLKERILGGLRPSDMSFEEKHWEYYKERFRQVIMDFKPDVIHIFGSEYYYGFVASITEIPVVLHIQGVLDTCRNAYFPVGMSPLSYYLFDLSPKGIWGRFQRFAEWKRLCVREQVIFKYVKNYIGRTDWDRACVKVFNKDANYFFGEEILRPIFYTMPNRKLPSQCTITTTISAAMYKGMDNVLKAAKCLKEIMGDDFVWNVYGDVNPKIAEKITKTHCADVNVKICGVVSSEVLYEKLQHTTVYYHSSYIENTSNAIGEAQMQSCPVVANYVGGVPSNMHQGVEGYLVPANDPYQTAYRIYEIYSNPKLAEEMGRNGREWAMKRHDKDKIISDLLRIYRVLITASISE